MRFAAEFEDNIDDIKRDTKEFYDRQARELEDTEKRYTDRMLDIKLMLT